MYSSWDVRELVNKLNVYRHKYYNENDSLITDKEYDELFDKLVLMEKETGIIFADSPTQSVGYKVVSDLDEVKHEFPPMLSLDKTKDITKIYDMFHEHPALVMAKIDGLTCRLTYEDGVLIRAETRGDGETGEDITHNVLAIANIPLTIPANDRVIIDGEVIVRRPVFAKLREKFVDNKGKRYKNPRNFAAGSVRLHDCSKASERGLEFIAWKLSKGNAYEAFHEGLTTLMNIGFAVTDHVVLSVFDTVDDYIKYTEAIKMTCEHEGIPIDGCVFSFNNMKHLETFDYTAHHWKAQMAYKFEDEKYDTVIRDIDWTMGKTGVLTPTAVFDTVEIDGTDVSRASLHNLTIMKQLNVRKNCSALVFKANKIIPQIYSVQDDGTDDFKIPERCPVCGAPTACVMENSSEMLMCSNDDCKGKLLGKLCTFVSKQGMNIDGLGESTLELFIELGLIRRFSDIYNLHNYSESIKRLEGKGESSVTKMMDSIEKSKIVSFENFLAALSIPNVGYSTAKTIAIHFNYDMNEFLRAVSYRYDFTCINGFGQKMSDDINDWFNNHMGQFELLLRIVSIRQPVKQEVVIRGAKIAGKTFCITGTFDYPRSSITKEIEAAGGIAVGSVTKKTDVLFVGEKAGSKLKKAQELGITIVEGEDYHDWIAGEFNA